MERVSGDVERRHFRITDLDALDVGFGVEFAAHAQAFLRRRGSDQFDHGEAAGQRLAAPDEARIGQKNGTVRQWARTGTRPRQPADQRYENAYLFGAICPARGTGAAIASPWVNTEAMQAHVDEIASKVACGAHAVLIMDRAAWHATSKLIMPEDITPILLPSRAPELNPVENIWQYMRANWLSNRIFHNYVVIIEAICEVWNNLIELPVAIKSIGMREWAHVGRSE